MQSVQLARGINVVNFQLLPGRILGFDYDQGRGTVYAEQINNVFSKGLPKEGPLIVCGDANYDERGRKPIEEVSPALRERGLRQVLPHGNPTRFTETGERLANDYVFVSEDLEVVEAQVREELSDGIDHFPLEVVVYERGM
jgi:endonuclease/exonuclease/phosphatase family metal-dependent hydrolase